MTEREMKEWQDRNELLQSAYKKYLFASKTKEKEVALGQIQKILEWDSFTLFCVDHDADVFGISRYGLDYQSEQCIGLIDKIAKGEMDYNL